MQSTAESFATYLGSAFRPLETLLSPELVEIVVNPDARVWVETRGDSAMRDTGLRLSEADTRNLVQQIANTSGIQFSEKKPVFTTSFTYGAWLIRAQVLGRPALGEGFAVALRFFSPSAQIFKPELLFGRFVSASAERRERNRRMRDMAEGGDLDGALALCVSEKLNVIVSGGTSSGKTMVARHLQSMIPDEERIITIEDAPDLLPPQPNKVMMISKSGDAYRSPDLLMQACLRMRPDRIILSEIRGADAYTFLKAINTGHGGSITTLHADTAELAVSRLAQAALEADAGMTYPEMTTFIAQSIDLIIHTAKVDGRRGITELFLPGETVPQKESVE